MIIFIHSSREFIDNLFEIRKLLDSKLKYRNQSRDYTPGSTNYSMSQKKDIVHDNNRYYRQRVQDHNGEKYKLQLKYIKEDFNMWKDIPCYG